MGTNVYMEDCCHTKNSQCYQQRLLRNEPSGHTQVRYTYFFLLVPYSLTFFFHLLHLLMIFANNCLVKAVIFDPTLSLLHDRESRRVAREQCVLANRDGAICRITLEERAISDLTIFPPEVLVYSVTIIDRLHVSIIASKCYRCFHSFLKIL